MRHSRIEGEMVVQRDETKLAITRRDEHAQRWRFFLQEVSEIVIVRYKAATPPTHFFDQFNDAYAVIAFTTLSKMREDGRVVVPEVSSKGQSDEQRTRKPDVLGRMPFEDALQFMRQLLEDTVTTDLYEESQRFTTGLDELTDKAATVLEELAELVEEAEQGLVAFEEVEALFQDFQQSQQRLQALLHNPKFKQLFADIRARLGKASKKPATQQSDASQDAGQDIPPAIRSGQRGGGRGA